MLEELEKVDWQKLSHAYGETMDIPGIVRNIASDDSSIRAQALFSLSHDIWRQETIYKAVTPFLIELLAAPTTLDKDALLVLLARLAAPQTSQQHNEVPSGTLEAADQQPICVPKARAAVRQGLATYLALLGESDPRVRMCAAYTLAHLEECAATTIPRLLTAFVQEHDPRVRANLLLSLEMLSRHECSAETTDLFLHSVNSREEPLVKLAAAMALTRQAGEKTPRRAVRILVNAIARPELIAEAYDELPWTNGSLISDISMTLRHLRPGMARIAIPALIDALANVGVYSALSITQTLLYLAFNDKKERALSVPQELTSEQRLVLSVISNCLSAWDTNSPVYTVWEAACLADFRNRLAS
ncbi:MAG: HEAT repeat domain-containing protein [Ktedonobacteraceae bacterium]